MQLSLHEEDQRFLWGTFFRAFAAKIPLVPLHLWLPEAHVEAPTVGSVLLAALLLKLGTYGLVRFSLPLFPEGTVYFAPIVSTLAIVGVIFTALTAIRQVDLKKIIAYSSVGHRNVVLLGRRAGTSEGLQGALFQRVSHGIVSGALFFAVGSLYERYSVRSLHYFGGLAHLYPLLTVVFVTFSLANLGFPPTSSFVGEFLVLLGVLPHSGWAALFACSSIVLGAIYTLWAVNRIFFGNLRTLSVAGGQDLSRKERWLFSFLIVPMVVLGILPSRLLDTRLIDSINILEHARLGRTV
jgi:NADH-quinone oxidoreductase subunit M